MHLATDKAAATLELAFAGSGVGFCGAHLKTGGGHIFVRARTNAPPPPGTDPMPGVNYCGAERSGCFATDALDTDLGADAAACRSIAADSFALHENLDASTDSGATVTPATIYQYFDGRPAGVADF